MKSLFVENTIKINAPAWVVWDVLTKPEYTKQYMFGCETVSDWKQHSNLQWKMMHEGKELVAVEGMILKIKPKRLLKYEAFDPNSNIDDESEQYITVTYELDEEDGYTILTVTQGDYALVTDGERRFKEAENGGEGWNPILQQIKKIAEAK